MDLIQPKDGPRTEYHKNGQKLTEENYKDGKWNGKWNWWYENGPISNKGN